MSGVFKACNFFIGSVQTYIITRKLIKIKKKRKLASKILPNLIDLIWEPSKTTEIKPR